MSLKKTGLSTSLGKSILPGFIAMVLLLASCAPHSRMVYLQNPSGNTDTLMFTKPEYRIKPGDILHVRVLTLDEESFIIFNNEESRQMGSGGGGVRNNITVYMHGYTVSEEGSIELPVLGKVQVSGKTIKSATEHTQQLLEQYLIGATVVVKLVNFSVTVLGEVRRPGNYYIYDNQLTLMDALGLAGDLTDYGNRRVKVIRQTADGAVLAEVDITDARSLSSNYYYLQPNDVVYVEPLKAKRLGFAQFPFGVLFSAISTTLLLLNFLK